MIELEIDSTVGFAAQLNDVPVVRRLGLTNRAGHRLDGLVVRLEPDPPFALPWKARLETLPEGATHRFESVDLQLLPSFLGGLTEGQRGLVRASVHAGSEVLAERSCVLDLLAYDHWGGLRSLPELLCAFVRPNEPAVGRVVRQASDLLLETTGQGGLTGYESSGRERCLITAEAVYRVLAREQIAYCLAAPGFAEAGQRVRSPEEVLAVKLANCLDIALLVASCLEHAGLHPLLVLVGGHAFPGVWLVDASSSCPVSDDGVHLRKLVDTGDVACFDTTLALTDAGAPFAAARGLARKQLEDAERFHGFLDVARSRQGRIRPLPSRRKLEDAAFEGEKTDDEFPLEWREAAVDGRTVSAPPPPAPAEDSALRLDRWKRKLLDLTLRNRLLDFRESRTKTLPILCPDLPALEDALADGKEFQLLPAPEDFRPGGPRSAELYEARYGASPLDEILRQDLAAKRLRTHLRPEELGKRMLEIYRAARVGLEEGGASGLFLALGFLRWYESAAHQQERRAPLILLPIAVGRRSVRQGFRIRLSDEDSRVNVTLLEYLKQVFELEVTGLDPLPMDASGIDVPRVLETFRRAILEVKRWEVLEEAQIGFFAFKKFLMWRDLEQHSDLLLQNRLVSHLVHQPKERFEPEEEPPIPDDLDAHFSPQEILCPLDADSSQLAAVMSADAGRTFVLKGPPGTGKSQTIGNLIAQCLAKGKTVLFVSEKMAALDVVQRRLAGVGLADYCLELHSNKAEKRRVVEQIARTLELARSQAPEDWQQRAAELEELRRRLNDYAGALHRRHANGRSVFAALGDLIALRDAVLVELAWSEDVDRDQLTKIEDVVERAATAAAACGLLAEHPWTGVPLKAWSETGSHDLRAQLGVCRSALAALAPALGQAASRLGLAAEGLQLADVERLDRVAELLLASPGAPAALLETEAWTDARERIESWAGHGKRRDELRSKVLAGFRPQILDLDLDALAATLEQARGASRWRRWWRRRPVIRKLRTVALPAMARHPDADAAVRRARSWRREQHTLDAAGAAAEGLLGRIWRSGEAAWDAVDGALGWADELRAHALELADGDPERFRRLRACWGALAASPEEVLGEQAPAGRDVRAFRRAFRESQEALRALGGHLDWRDGAPGFGARRLDEVEVRLAAWEEHFSRLRPWCAWQRARADALNLGLAPLLAALESARIGNDRDALLAAFRRSYLEWWIRRAIDGEPILRDFQGTEHERLVARFRELDRAFRDLTAALIRARLSANVPMTAGPTISTSEVGTLRHEAKKKARHKPLRQLFQEIPSLLPRLRPCLLMSPVSVAQYLRPDADQFDVVVFDEASQIPVWDAVGAIARGRQVVVAGDPKQLPPTDFFQRSFEDEPSDELDVEDLESVLDDCLAGGVRSLDLQWHYRSRHESLIAFSNHHYYDNRLLTFPSVDAGRAGVHFHFVRDGIYDRGKSRTNRREAELLVADVVRRLGDPAAARTLGVVTFSQAQQVLIEDLFEEARRQHPEIDPFFSEGLEPVFVKNLENVQGDERDVILFSICYGPDLAGKVAMSFGPVNRQGGERRLNVAITRARHEVHVYSGLRAEQIDLARSRARGVEDLKSFLEYAEHGPPAVVRTVPAAGGDPGSPFERDVENVLRDLGWQVDSQVGCSGYRIDLAVVDPDAPDRYLLGVECDGVNYCSAKTARDRDRLRDEVLRGLGWTLHRIWSTDWRHDRGREIEKLTAALAPEPISTFVPATAPPIAPPAPAERYARAATTEPARRPPRTSHYDSFVTLTHRDASELYLPQTLRVIRRVLEKVVETEGPVAFEVAARRVARCWSLKRLGKVVVETISNAARDAGIRRLTEGDKTFFWPPGLDPDRYDRIRIPNPRSPEDFPAADEIAPQEIANAARWILESHVSVPLEDLLRETARVFGIQRAGTKVREAVLRGIELLERKGRVRIEGGSVVLRGRPEGPAMG